MMFVTDVAFDLGRPTFPEARLCKQQACENVQAVSMNKWAVQRRQNQHTSYAILQQSLIRSHLGVPALPNLLPEHDQLAAAASGRRKDWGRRQRFPENKKRKKTVESTDKYKTN